MKTLLALFILAGVGSFFARRRLVLLYDAIRLRGRYGAPAIRPRIDQLTAIKRTFETDVIHIDPSGIDMLVSMHGETILRHTRGIREFIRAKRDSASIVFLPSNGELKVISVSGKLPDILSAIKSIKSELGYSRISQIRICCATKGPLKKALLTLAGARKTGHGSEVIIK